MCKDPRDSSGLPLFSESANNFALQGRSSNRSFVGMGAGVKTQQRAAAGQHMA